MKQAGTKNTSQKRFLLDQRQWWLLATIVAVLVLLSPILCLFPELFKPLGSAWNNLKETVLPAYISNTLILIAGVGLGTVLLGFSSAYLTSMYRFPGARFLRFGLLLPLAIPSYIAAYVFSGVTEYSGPLHLIGRGLGQNDWHVNIMHLPGLIVVLSLVLYPYIFATARVSLESRYNSYIENARSLGLKGTSLLLKVILPLLRPALIGGVFLVIMEVLNDYGAMKYFGITTFTTGIFTAWFSMNDLNSAVRLALMLFVLVALLSYLENWFSRKHKVTESTRSKKSAPKKLTGVPAILAGIYTWGLFIIAFITPVAYLAWSIPLDSSKTPMAMMAPGMVYPMEMLRPMTLLNFDRMSC